MNKKKKKMPVARGVWKINPKTRVKPSRKIYKRAESQEEIDRETEHFSET